MLKIKISSYFGGFENKLKKKYRVYLEWVSRTSMQMALSQHRVHALTLRYFFRMDELCQLETFAS